MASGRRSLNPGQRAGAITGARASANQPGSQNYAGISDPAIDELIQQDHLRARIATNRSRPPRRSTACLLAHHYVVPMFYSQRLAHRLLGQASTGRRSCPITASAFPTIWWSKPPRNERALRVERLAPYGDANHGRIALAARADGLADDMERCGQTAAQTREASC